MVQISATAQLKQYIDRYLDERNGRSRQTLAKKTGVSYSTLSRIASLECETTFEHAIHILKEVASDDEREGFIKQYYPATFAALTTKEAKVSGKDDAFLFLNDRINYELFSLSCHIEGLKPEYAQTRYGTAGLEACNNLVENGLLSYDSEAGTFRANNLTASAELLQILLQTGLANVNEVAAKTNKYHMFWFSESLTPEACSEIHKLLREVDIKISNIMTSPNNQGSIPYEYGVFSKPMKVQGDRK